MKYIYRACCFVGTALAISACQISSDEQNANRAAEFQPQISYPTSVVVCRSKQCAPAKLSMSREYIYNSLMQLLEHNVNEKALICQADPFTHVCTEDYLTLPITVGVTPANMYLNDVEISDVSVALSRRSMDLLLNYGVSYNGQVPTCKPSKTLVYVKNAENIVLEDSGYACKMATIGNTTIKTLFAIDYIDLDYGFIGGYYSIGLSGPAYGGRSGYMMFKLKNDAYPLSEDLIFKEPEPQIEQQSQEIVTLGEPVYGYEVYEECPGTVLTGKDRCPFVPRPQPAETTVVFDNDPKAPRITGVSSPAPKDNLANKDAVNTNTIEANVKETTDSSVYEKAVSEDLKGTEYNGVEVFPIYNKKKK